MRAAAAIAIAAALLASGCGDDATVSGPAPEAPARISLRTPAFGNGQAIPKPYTCDGKDTSPPLGWSGVPRSAKELAILVEDPDAPGGTFVHWLIFGLGPQTDALDEGGVPEGARQAKNSFGEAKYSGPCPPKGEDPHRYVFSIYALRAPIDAANGADAGQVRDEIRDKALASGRLTGRFGR
jgi:Raf kinase inhibitor-like YbhB/YbcL family protein